MDPLATPADLEIHAPGLNLPSTRADFFLGQASAAVRSYCEWHVAPAVTENLTVDGSGALLQGLPTLHLTAVTSITEDATSVDLADVEWSEAGYLVRRDRPWTCKLRGIIAGVTHGHPEIPEELVAVVCTAAARAAVSPTGETREQTGPFSVTRSQVAPGVAGGVVLLDHEKRILDRYRLP